MFHAFNNMNEKIGYVQDDYENIIERPEKVEEKSQKSQESLP